MGRSKLPHPVSETAKSPMGTFRAPKLTRPGTLGCNSTNPPQVAGNPPATVGDGGAAELRDAVGGGVIEQDSSFGWGWSCGPVFPGFTSRSAKTGSCLVSV